LAKSEKNQKAFFGFEIQTERTQMRFGQFLRFGPFPKINDSTFMEIECRHKNSAA